MNTKYILISIIGVLIISIGVLIYTNNQYRQTLSHDLTNQRQGQRLGQGNRNGTGLMHNQKNCISDECLAIDTLNYPAGELTETVKNTLTKALDDEYKAQATYEAVINKIGSVRPFIMIIRAEEQHISSLKSLFDKYGMLIPQNPYTGKVTSPATLTEACKAGVSAETSNASLYKDTLLPNVKNYEDITLVFTNLMNASQQKHLVAFQKCE